MAQDHGRPVRRQLSMNELAARFHTLTLDPPLSTRPPLATKPRAQSMCVMYCEEFEPEALPTVPTIDEDGPAPDFMPNKRQRCESESKRSGLVSRVRKAYSAMFRSNNGRPMKLRTVSQPESSRVPRPAIQIEGASPFHAPWTPPLPGQPFVDSMRVSAAFSPLAGAAARQSVARHNGFERPYPRLDGMYVPRLRSQSPDEGDRESAVSLSIDPKEEPASPIDARSNMTKIDPLEVLPVELAAHILSSLDHATLAKMERVSRSWQEIALDNQLWRKAFSGRFPAPQGWHPDIKPGDQINWKSLFKARSALAHQWHTGQGQFTRLHGHTDSVYCVQHDDEKIITGSRDRTIRIWDMRTLACLKVVGLPEAIDNDWRMMKASVNESGNPFDHCQARLSEPDKRLYHTPSYYHMASILCLQYDDEICITGSSDCSLIVWDIKTWEPIRRLQQHHGGVLDVAFDKRKIISCSKDTTICVWDRATGELMHVLTGHRGPVNAVQMRGDLIVSASGEGCAKLWNLNLNSSTSPMCVREFWSVGRGLACVEFSADARYIFAGGNDQSIYKFDATTGHMIEQMMGHDNLVRSLYLDGSGGRLISGSYDLSLRVWDFESGRQILEFPDWSKSWLLSAKSDYRRIVSTGQDGRITVLDFGHDVADIDLLRGTNPGRALSY